MKPDYQMGEACLADQLVGQYMAHVLGLGYLLDGQHVKQALKSIFRYNYLPDMSEHEAVQRTFALNDDAAVVIASYPHGERPEIPFPYFSEVMDGFEYQLAVHLIYEGMLTEGLTVTESVRLRFVGERRNPWNEPECGHHYARGMASWAAVLALSGFQYHGAEGSLLIEPRINPEKFFSFWSTGTGWGTFSQTVLPSRTRVSLRVVEGRLGCRRVALRSQRNARRPTSARLGSRSLSHETRREENRVVLELSEEVTLKENEELILEV